MKGSIRVSAKTLDDAITEALVQLGVTSDRLEYNVIEKGSSGFLGIGMKQAVIEAWKKEEKKEESVKAPVKEDISQTTEEPAKKEERKKEEVIKETAKSKKENQAISSKEIKAEREEKEKAPVKEQPELAKVEEQTIHAVEQFVNDTLKAMDMEVEVTSSIDEDGALCIDMHQAGYVRVKLDTEDYRARREETLRHLAKNIAYKVKRNRRPVVLEPMNPYERRIIHSALQSDPYVTTHSEGEDPYRKVVVTLKR